MGGLFLANEVMTLSSDPKIRRGLIATQAILFLAAIPIAALPIWWGILEKERGYSLVDFGVLQTSYAISGLIGGLIFAVVLGRLNRRVTMIVLALAYAISLSLIAFVPSALAVAIFYALGSAAFQAIETICLTTLGNSGQAERQTAIYVTIGTVLYGLIPLLLPLAALHGGFISVQIMVVCSVLIVVPLVLAVPRPLTEAPVRSTGQDVSYASNISFWAVCAMVAISLFTWLTSTLFAFSEQYGVARGIGLADAGLFIGLSQFAGVPASLLISWRGDRIGLWLPVAIGGAVMAAAIALLAFTGGGRTGYFGGLVLFSMAWSFMLPSLISIFARIDPSGRALALSYPMRNAIWIMLSAALTGGLAWKGLIIVTIVTAFVLITVVISFLLAYRSVRSLS
jgi:predicted MFS family arabinose efflux permease